VTTSRAKFAIGQLIHHRLFDYRGVVVDVDPTFQGTEEWYEQVARSRPPKDQPWYHVLVHDAQHTTYVAERNLEPDDSQDPIRHPLLFEFFETFQDGRYTGAEQLN
jgi:heat shock protein HspQ